MTKAKKEVKPRVSRFEYVTRLQGEARHRDGLVITKLVAKYHKKYNDPTVEEVEAHEKGLEFGKAHMRIVMNEKIEKLNKGMDALEAKILAHDPKTAARRAVQWVRGFFIGTGK